jgi:DNA-binding NtrC family response regulator
MAVEAMRVGAFDFLEKPFNPDRMTELAKRATQARRMTLDNRALRKELSDGSVLMKKLVGTSPAQTQAFAAAERVKWKEAVEISGAQLD